MSTVHRLTLLCLLFSVYTYGCKDDPSSANNNNNNNTVDTLNWSTTFTESASVDGKVTAIAFMGGNLYVGGDFLTAGTSTAMRAAQWNGTTWSEIGNGFDFLSDISAMASENGILYIGGELFRPGHQDDVTGIFQWDGTTMLTVGAAGNDAVSDLTAVNNSVYWTYQLGVSRQPVNGYPEGFGKLPNLQTPTSVAVNGTSVYAAMRPLTGGDYKVFQSISNTWTQLGGVFGSSSGRGTIRDMAVAGGKLYAAGQFNEINDVAHATPGIALWDGTNWVGVGSLSITDPVTALAVDAGGNLYAAAGATLRKWNGSVWRTVATVSGGDAIISAVAIDGSRIAIGGDFTSVDGKPSFNLAVTQ